MTNYRPLAQVLGVFLLFSCSQFQARHARIAPHGVLVQCNKHWNNIGKDNATFSQRTAAVHTSRTNLLCPRRAAGKPPRPPAPAANAKYLGQFLRNISPTMVQVGLATIFPSLVFVL